jgi:hypothetical protein|nr:MAG TPA: hypothetical protein [Caudoviricetes sp.]
MFYFKGDFNTNGQRVIERHAYVVIGRGPRAHSIRRNVYENEDMDFYVYYEDVVITVEENGEVWFSE